MSFDFDAKTSISNENPKLMIYLVNKLNSRKNKLLNIKENLKIINSKEEYFNQKNSTVKFLDELLKDFQQAISAIKALLTENKALSISNNAKEEEIKKQKKENEDLKQSIFLSKNNFKNNKDNFINDNFIDYDFIDDNFLNDDFIALTEGNSKKEKKNVLNDTEKKNKNSVIKYKNSRNHSFSSFNSNSNELLIKIMNNAENLNLLNQKLGKNVIKKLIDPNCSKEYYSKVKKILNENEINNNLKVPIRMKNTIQAKINSQKSNNKKIKNKNSVLTNKKNSSQRNLKEFNKNVFDNYTN